MKCKFTTQDIIGFIDGYIDMKNGEELKVHLENCGECRKKLAILRFYEGFSSAEHDMEKSLSSSIIAAVDKKRYTGIRFILYSRFNSFRPFLKPVAVAVICLALVLSFTLNRDQVNIVFSSLLDSRQQGENRPATVNSDSSSATDSKGNDSESLQPMTKEDLKWYMHFSKNIPVEVVNNDDFTLMLFDEGDRMSVEVYSQQKQTFKKQLISRSQVVRDGYRVGPEGVLTIFKTEAGKEPVYVKIKPSLIHEKDGSQGVFSTTPPYLYIQVNDSKTLEAVQTVRLDAPGNITFEKNLKALKKSYTIFPLNTSDINKTFKVSLLDIEGNVLWESNGLKAGCIEHDSIYPKHKK